MPDPWMILSAALYVGGGAAYLMMLLEDLQPDGDRWLWITLPFWPVLIYFSMACAAWDLGKRLALRVRR